MAKEYRYYVTAGINAAIERDAHFAKEVFLATNRYAAHDWGDLCEDDKELNRRAKTCGGRILAAYPSTRGRVYIITDDTKANPQITTVLFVDEY